MRDNDIIILILIFMVVISVFFGSLGLGFHGMIEKPTVNTADKPGLLEVISWSWNGLFFIFGMIAFQVDGVAPWQNLLFIVACLMLLWIVLKWVRGSNQGV